MANSHRLAFVWPGQFRSWNGPRSTHAFAVDSKSRDDIALTMMTDKGPARMANGSRKRRSAILAFSSCLLLQPLLACASEAVRPAPTDYAQASNWMLLPRAETPGTAHAVDVFFVYPTTYGYDRKTGPALTSEWSAGWNQSLAQAYADPIIKYQVESKIGVFAKAGTRVYVPYYRQASGFDVLNAVLWKSTPQLANAANEAMQVAYSDVSAAFDFYLAHHNKDADGKPRPLILAGHSQGSNLLLYLLQDKFKDAELRKRLIAAYIIGWSVTSDDLASYPDSLARVGICDERTQTGCIVSYNTQQTPGDWTQLAEPWRGKMELVRKNAYSVNPLTWSATGPDGVEAAAPASANLGAVFFKGSLPGADPALFAASARYEVKQYTGAQSDHGALIIDPTALPAPASYANFFAPYNTLPGWYHGYDYSFFYRNIEQNVIDRIQAYLQKH